jgi:hypothetical protein
MRCLYSDDAKCIANIPEACCCAQMPRFAYVEALRRRIEEVLDGQKTQAETDPEA